ncbi:MAG TPA: response regulator [Ferruginibacter sp.]|nr:response regulator [Ferruginibacter sp.]
MNPIILVIDDNEDILFMLKAMLQLKEYKVYTKETAENIEAYIEQLAPNIILMDMLLSGADGCEVCKSIKTNSAISSIQVIMMSALPSAKEMCLEAGANYFVGKPFEMTDLFYTVSNALAKSEMGAI